MGKRILVGYGIDIDAVSGWINTEKGTPEDPADVSRGVFGATVGVDRLLKLWDKFNIKTSWFIPAHTIESFRKQMAKIRDAGHEIGLHGYTHEFPSNLSEEQERNVLAKSIEVLTNFTGVKPRGWTAPAWLPSTRSVQLLEEFGIEYDHSFMHHDSQPYYLPYPPTNAVTDLSLSASSWMLPMFPAKTSKIVCIPANWHLDDWPAFQPNALGASSASEGFIDPHVVERMWREHFDYLYREYDEFIMPISIHPQVSGKPQVILMHERFIEYVNGKDGVEWCTFEEMARRYRCGDLKGASVEI